jgi:hypothetical protein
MKWVVLSILLVSCQQEKIGSNSCGVNNPLQELAWLKRIAEDSAFTSSIVQGTYQGQTVYAVGGCARCFAGPSVTLYHCDGSNICSSLVSDQSSSTCAQLIANLSNKRTLFEQKP